MSHSTNFGKIQCWLEDTCSKELAYEVLQGFSNVLLRAETAADADNPYEPTEQPHYSYYRAGAIAAMQLKEELVRVSHKATSG